MTLACADANTKLVEVVAVADVNAEKRFDGSFVQIWKLKFGHEVKFLFRLCAQGLVIFELKFRPDYEAEGLSVFCC